jgi:DNA-binding response OmpR family regulator
MAARQPDHPAGRHRAPEARMSETRILIVDDDPEVIEALEVAFAGKPWEVEAVLEASVALGRHRKRPYDLLIVDKNLPDLDGVELIRQLRTDQDRVRIVVLTGYASAESAVDSLNLAIDAYLLKPFASADVVETVEDVLARSAAASPEAPHLFDVEPAASQPKTAPMKRKPEAPPRSEPALRLAPPPNTVEEVLFGILIASADPHARAHLASTLEAVSGEILFASDVGEMLSTIKSRPLGVVIIQGALDAAEVVARIRAHSPDLPCVVLVEAAGLAGVTWLIELRITALLTDPLESPTLTRRLNEILRNLRVRQREQRDEITG